MLHCAFFTQLQDTIRQLKLDLDLAMTEKANLEKENELLRGEMQVHAPGAPGKHSVGDKETISVLEQQVQILTEDFRSERADRERAQSLIAELQQERKLTKRQVGHLPSKHNTLNQCRFNVQH